MPKSSQKPTILTSRDIRLLLRNHRKLQIENENLIKKCRKSEMMFESSRTLLNIVISNDIDLNSEDTVHEDSCHADTKDNSYRLPRLFH